MSRYSNDFRKQVAKQFEAGVSIISICSDYNISETTAYLWRIKLKEGNLYDEVHIGGKPTVYDLEGLKQFVINNPDKLLREINDEFFGGKASTSGIDKALSRMDFRLKKE